MFQKCRNSIILPAALPLNVTGDAQIMCPDPTALTLHEVGFLWMLNEAS